MKRVIIWVTLFLLTVVIAIIFFYPKSESESSLFCEKYAEMASKREYVAYNNYFINCMENEAHRLNDPSLCKGNPVPKAMCFGRVVKSIEKCKEEFEITKDFTKDFLPCIIGVAEITSQTEPCKELISMGIEPGFSALCIVYAAEYSNNTNMCNELNEKLFINSLNSSLRVGLYDRCLSDIFLKTNDPSICPLFLINESRETFCE